MPNVFDSISIAKPSATQATAPINKQNSVKVEHAASAPVLKNDEAVISSSQEKKKGGTISNAIAGIKKFCATVGEHSKGAFKGLNQGLVNGSVVYTLGTIVNKVRAKKEANPIPAAVLGVGIGVATFAVNLWQGHLNANEKKSQIEHRWIGH